MEKQRKQKVFRDWTGNNDDLHFARPGSDVLALQAYSWPVKSSQIVKDDHDRKKDAKVAWPENTSTSLLLRVQTGGLRTLFFRVEKPYVVGQLLR